MTQTFREKYLGGASYKLVFSILSGLIALLMLTGLIVGVVALFKESSGTSPLIVALKAFLNAIYLPSIVILILIIVGALLYATIMMISETSGGSAKITILLIAVFVFGVSGTVKPLINYRPEPTTGYLITSFIVFLLLLALNVFLNYSNVAVPKAERHLRLVILFPFVILTNFFIVSLIFAMIQYIKYGVVEEGFEKLCTGIIMPIFALACLLIPLGVGILLAEDDPDIKKPEAATEPVKEDENSEPGAPPSG